METEFEYRRRVSFSDTDMAGIAHFTNFFRYMEEAEHAFLRERGLSVVMNDEKGKLGFPKLSVGCDFKRPARYDDVLDLRLKVRCEKRKSLAYQCQFRCGENEIAVGRLLVAYCRFPADKPPYAIPLPESVLEKLFPRTH